MQATRKVHVRGAEGARRAGLRRLWHLAALFIVAATVLASAQHQHGADPAGGDSPHLRPIDYLPAVLGPHSRRISSSVPETQQFFDQGLQFLYAFGRSEAIRSFRAAWSHDPSCAICYWGEALAWGSYLNRPMTAEDGPFAWEALQQAVSRRESASPVERDLIDALRARYSSPYDEATRVDLDRAYADAMGRLAERYADDLDIRTLHAYALFLLEPRRGTRDITAPSVQRLFKLLEDILAVDLRHPGACHLYVHATEATTEPHRAEACAEQLGALVPGASHMVHMPAHTFSLVGRWGDAVRASIQAWHADLKTPLGQGISTYPDHNLLMLVYAASMDGQGGLAVQAARDLQALTGLSFFHDLTLVRFGRFDWIPADAPRPADDLSAGARDFALGYAALRRGEVTFARGHLERLRALEGSSQAMFRFHTAANLLGTLAGILEGEILRHEGRLDDAIAAFRRGVDAQDRLTWDEPEPLPFASRHWLGAALNEAGRFAEAEAVFRDDLRVHPHNGWALIGLESALASQQRDTSTVTRDLQSSWQRADTWLRAPRF